MVCSSFSFTKLLEHFLGRIFKQSVGIPMGAIFASLIYDHLIFSYKSELLQILVEQKDNKSYSHTDTLSA